MNRDWIATAQTLSQALPFLQRYADATVVIKLGGHAMGSDAAMDEFARDVALMRQVGVNPVIVHGGGPMINDMLARLNIKSEFVNGKRVTDAATMEVVEMVLSGLVNARIVQAISEQGGRAVGVSGKDSGLIVCEPEDPALGLVGNPTQVNPRILRDFADKGIIPVIAPLGMGRGGETYNINGDTAAGAIAGALKADRLLLLTDVAGVKDGAGEVVMHDSSPSWLVEGGQSRMNRLPSRKPKQALTHPLQFLWQNEANRKYQENNPRTIQAASPATTLRRGRGA